MTTNELIVAGAAITWGLCVVVGIAAVVADLMRKPKGRGDE